MRRFDMKPATKKLTGANIGIDLASSGKVS
jgi:hypothetical protein